MEVSYYGHSCFGIDTGSAKLLIDPFITPNELAAHIKVEDIEVDKVLITHGHEDHLADAEQFLKRPGVQLVSNYEIILWYGTKGIENIVGMNIGGTYREEGLSIKYVNASHSSVLPDGNHGGNPGGFVIKSGGKCVYHAGDTGLLMDMELLGRHENIDVAFLPIGDLFTMGVDDAMIAADMLNCSHVVGMHYDTWPPLVIDKDAAREKFANAGKKLTLLDIGSAMTI